MTDLATRTGAAAADHTVVHRDPHAYCAHPHLLAAEPGNWLLVFTQAPRRAGIRIHPPQDPLFRNLMTRSTDEGRTWSTPVPVPGYGWSGMECAGLTALAGGTVLLNQWRFDWLTAAEAARLPPEATVPSDRLVGRAAMAAELAAWTPDEASIRARFPWARGGGRTFVHRSDDGGATFAETVEIATAPFSGGYGMRGGVVADGEVVLPLCDVPNYRAVFVVRSADGGRTWSAPSLAAAGEGHEFEEPAPLLLPSGRILMMLRDNASRILHRVVSDDGGRSWSAPAATGIADYPADLLLLPDGRIGLIAGRRRPPYGITFHVSGDGGETWNADRPLWVRRGLPSADLGYPTMALRADGRILAVYYTEDEDGVTGIHATAFDPDALEGGPGHGGD